MSFLNKIFGKKEEEQQQLKDDLDQGLEKSRKSFFGKVAHAFAGRTKVDDEIFYTTKGGKIVGAARIDKVIEEGADGQDVEVEKLVPIKIPESVSQVSMGANTGKSFLDAVKAFGG